MTIEEIIKQILSKHPEIPREQILERLAKEKTKTGGLISDVALLRMLAAEFGTDLPQNEVHAHKLSLRDLIPSLSDVTVSGRIVAAFTPKAFEGKRSGKFASLFIADKDAVLRVVFWNDKVNLIESGAVKVGQIIRLSHGYTREDRNGKVELHIGSKSEIDINPQNVEAEDYATISKFATRIVEITPADKNKRVNVVGAVSALFPPSTFKRRDLSSGKVMRFTLADKTGEIPVVVWNEKVDELERTLKKNVELDIVNAKVKTALGGGLEIHVDAGTYAGVSAKTEEFIKVANLKEGLSSVNVEGEVATRPAIRDVKTSKGEVVKIAVFELKDETGKIWVSAWRKHADVLINVRVGDKIIIKNAYVKKGFSDQQELSTRSATSIIVSS